MICDVIKNKKLLDAPGVYKFLDARRRILYIGKATSLRDRVKSYCVKGVDTARGPIIVEMLEKTHSVSLEQTDSVLDALILEAVLIKKYQPKYNTKEKSDKSFNYVVITDEDFPRILIIREKELLGRPTSKFREVNKIFGPFPHGGQLRQALKIIRKIFPFRDMCKIGQKNFCFNSQIGLCPGVCVGNISKTEYRKTIKNIKLFFDGKKRTLVKNLEKEMSVFAKKQEFEKANKIKKTIFAIKHIQDVSLIKNTTTLNFLHSTFKIEAYDVAHLSGDALVGAMSVVENGETEKRKYRKFKIKSIVGINDTKALSEILSRRLSHTQWQFPNLIVVDGGKAQINAAKRVLDSIGAQIQIVGVVKDERHKPKRIEGKSFIARKYEKEILLANNEAHRFAIGFHHQQLRRGRGVMFR